MDCSICFEELGDDVVTTECNHLFHRQCIRNWLREHSSCPLCRSVIGQEHTNIAFQDYEAFLVVFVEGIQMFIPIADDEDVMIDCVEDESDEENEDESDEDYIPSGDDSELSD
jgi:hypothetical protein